MKKLLSLFAVVGMLTLTGCGPFQKTFFTSTTKAVVPDSTNGLPSVTNLVTTLAPNPAAIQSVQNLGSLFGVYGSSIAGLFVSGLSLFASWHNRKALGVHIQNTT